MTLPLDSITGVICTLLCNATKKAMKNTNYNYIWALNIHNLQYCSSKCLNHWPGKVEREFGFLRASMAAVSRWNSVERVSGLTRALSLQQKLTPLRNARRRSRSRSRRASEGKEGGASEVWLSKPTQGNRDFTLFHIVTESSRLIIFLYNL